MTIIIEAKGRVVVPFKFVLHSRYHLDEGKDVNFFIHGCIGWYLFHFSHMVYKTLPHTRAEARPQFFTL